MAVTIEQEPLSLSPSDNDVTFVFSSDKTSEVNFEYKVEVYIDNVSQGEEKVYPISGENSYINASELLKSLFNTPEIPTDISSPSDLIVDAQAHKECYIVVTEVYGDPQADQASATSSTIDIFKSRVSDEDFIGLSTSQYVIGASDKQFLSNFNRDKKYWVDTRKSNYISFYLGSTTVINIEIRTYDLSSNLIDTHIESIGSKIKGLYNINISKKEYPSLDFTDAYFYEVIISDSGNSQITERFRYYINEPCTTDRTVYFINKLGGIDSWLFSKKKSVSRKFSRENYERSLGSLNSSSYEYSKFRGSEINYLNRSGNTIKLLSDWNDIDIQTWLVKELLESPIVWTEDSSDTKKRLIVTNSSESEPQERYEELVNLEIDFKESLTSKSALY